MDTIIRAAAVYFILLVIFRIAGQRTLSQVTTFDLILALIISEAVQEALVDNDGSITNAVLIVVTLVGLSILLSLVKQRFSRLERVLDGTPLVLVEEGRLHRERMERERIDEGDILEAARELQGLSRLDQVAYAVLEKGGRVTVIPR